MIKGLVFGLCFDISFGLAQETSSFIEGAANQNLFTAKVKSERAKESHSEGDVHEKHKNEDENPHDHEPSETHSEFHATYKLKCNSVKNLTSLDQRGLLGHYPDILDLDVQFALENSQGIAVLNAMNTKLRF